MASLSKHGGELARIEALSSRKAYMADGTILKNIGFGWKIYGKIKAGLNPHEVAAKQLELARTFPQRRPAAYAYRVAFHRAVAFSHRWKVLQAIDALGDDIDGIWSTLDDDYELRGQLSCDDIQELADFRRAAVEEYCAMNPTAAAIAD